MIFLLAACGGSDQTEVQPPPEDSGASTESAEGPEEGAGPETVSITGNDQMQFSLTEFTVKAGSEVEIVFENAGQLPKEAMGHNLLILTQETDPLEFATASMIHRDNDYVAPELADQVIAGTELLGPGESETLTFTAPEETGDYPFLCSFPNHAAVGMRGVMTVE